MGRSALVGAVGALVLVLLGGTAEAGPRLRKGPYLQNLTPSSITVMWEVDERVPATVVVTGGGGERRVRSGSDEIAEVVVDGLQPATRYTYRVEFEGDGPSGKPNLTGEFATAPPLGTPGPLSFVVFGDTRSNADSHRRVMDRAAAEIPDFVLGTGDMVDEGHREDQWQTYFDVERDVLRNNVLFPSLGNHDRQGRGRTADTYRALFAVPENSPNPERYYAFSYGHARFLVLDSNSHSFALTDQTSWLESELIAARQDARVRHIFVVMHHPPFSISLHGGQRDLRERWTPLFEQYQVTAVFSGHDHVYSRAEHNGIRYFVTGGGGAPLYPRSQRATALDKKAVVTFERVLHYLRVHLHGDQVEVSAIRVDGTAIETISWGEPPRPAGPASATAPVPQSAPAVGAPAPGLRGPASPGRGGFGWLGALGVAAALVAAVVMVRALRS
ncbi:MAG: metallophosphoesterase [Kofleriaceae bacterium]|nr:metallophosphoesterase [Kofleriaceae bacterium]